MFTKLLKNADVCIALPHLNREDDLYEEEN